MLRVGITGGIGSGKSTVCAVFRTMGVPVSSADDTARLLMEHDPVMKAGILRLFGDPAYLDGRLNRQFLSACLLDADKRLALNALVHPAVVEAGQQWFAQQTGAYAIKESALFFESGTESSVDVMIGVHAPPEIRIARLMERSGLSPEAAAGRIAAQMDETEKMKRCDYIVINDGREALLPQILSLHTKLLLS